MIKRSRLTGIEALRGYAASSVIMLHATKIHLITIPTSINTYVTYCAYGVPLFFVISAFSLAYGYSGRNAEPGWKTVYTIRRFFRIAPLFYSMIAAWTFYRLWLGGSPFKPLEYLLNTTFTFGLFPGYQSSVVPAGWSIGAEMIFYALFPLLLKYVNSLNKALVAFPAALCVSYLVQKAAILLGWRLELFYWINIFNNMPYFIFGILSFHLFTKLDSNAAKRQWSNILLFVAFGLAFVNVITDTTQNWTFSDEPPPLRAVAGWALAFGSLVTSQALAPNKIIVNRVTIFLGSISFSLYLIHPLVLYASPVLPWIEALSAAPLVKALLAWAFAFTAVVPLAWLTYKLIEVPGQALGKLFTAPRRNGENAFASLRRILAAPKKGLETNYGD